MRRLFYSFIVLSLLSFTGCGEDAEQPAFNLTSASDGSGLVSLEICGDAADIYVSLDRAAQEDVQIQWKMSSEGYLSLTPAGETHFSGSRTLLTYHVQCSDNPDKATVKEILLTAETESSHEAFDGLRSTLKVTCTAGADESCIGHGKLPDDPLNPVDCSVYPNCLMYDSCDPTACSSDGTPAIRIAPLSGLITNESGKTDTFQIVLGSKPSSDVVITFKPSDDTEARLAQASLTFTPSNWNTPQTVTVAGVDDPDTDGDIAYTIDVLSVTSADPQYNGIPVASVKATNKDNEPRSETVSFTMKYNGSPNAFALDLYETGLADAFTLMLNAEPSADVTVQITSSHEDELKILTPSVTFTQAAWRAIKTLRVQAVADGVMDGDKQASIGFSVTSDDPRYNGYTLAPIPVTIHDTDQSYTEPVTVRIMAANITTGTKQSYDLGHGKRIFQAMKPDIVLIQEFNMRNDTIDNFVRSTFGNAYNYYRGTGDIPNGIISRYPILSTGQWKSPQISDRGFNWAVIDIPGDKDLLAVSVHLSTDTAKHISEMASLETQVPTQSEGRYVVLGGDFNTSSNNVVRTNLDNLFPINSQLEDEYWPCDQRGNISTNAGRSNQYDYVLASDDLHALATPLVIGEHTYPYGHVFDSRVYNTLGEIGDVSPVLPNDSAAEGMQHMAVIRDFVFTP